MTPFEKDALSGVELINVARSVLVYQTGITVLVTATFLLADGLQAGIAALYGGSTALILTCLRKRNILRVTELNSGNSMSRLYLGAAQRFFGMLALFAVALAVLRLDPLACIIGFGLCQLAYLFSRVLRRGQ